MPVPKRWLNDDETVAVDLHPHWSYLVAPLLLVAVVVGAGIVALRTTDPDAWTRDVAGWLTIGAIAVAIVWLLVRYARWHTTSFVITNDRVIYRSGFLSKRGIEIPLERINAVHYEQSLLGRLVGSGDVIIESGGEFGQQTFLGLRDPAVVQRALHVQLDVNERRNRGDAALTDPDVVGQLERLEGMLDRGTITSEEFEVHKQRLLER